MSETESASAHHALSVNGEPHEIESGASLLDLLDSLNVDPRTVAIELGEEVVPRAQFGARILGAGDRVEIVRFVQGG